MANNEVKMSANTAEPDHRGNGSTEEDAGDVLTSLVRAVRIGDSTAKLSFLDQQHKWDTREDAEEVAKAVESASNMEVFELRGNTLGVEAGKRIAESLRSHPELQRALWSDLFTGRMKDEIPPVLRSLCDSMMNCGVRLVELDLSDNAFGPIGAEGIEQFLESPSAYSLQVLKLNNNGLGGGGKVIAKALKQCFLNARRDGHTFRLKTFVAGRNRLEVPGAVALADAFQLIGSLEEVTMHQDGITAKGIEALAVALGRNPNLKVLNLSDNTFTPVGARAMAKVLPSLKELQSLNFSDCLCQNEGAIAIVSSLRSSTHLLLKEVNLSGNELSAAATEKVIRAFDAGFHLESLSVHTNNLGRRFDELKCYADGLGFVDLGEESDDQGSLDDDDDEDEDGAQGDSDAGDSGGESDDERTDDVVPDIEVEKACTVAFTPVTLEDIILFSRKPTIAVLNSFAAQQSAVVDILRKELKGRTQEVVADFLYSVASLIPVKGGGDSDVPETVVNLADAVMKAAEETTRTPLSATEQICNLLIAYAGALQSESLHPINADMSAVIFLFESLIRKGHFKSQASSLKFFFDGEIRKRHPSQRARIDKLVSLL